LEKDSVYTLGLARKGIRLDRGRDVEVLEMLTVKDIMQPAPIQICDTDSLADAHDLLSSTRHHGAPVIDSNGRLVGILTLQDLDRISTDEWALHSVGETCTHELMVAYPDETIGRVLHRMNIRDIGRLPVVNRNQPDVLVGWLRRTDLLHAYDIALERRAAMRHRAHSVMLGASSDARILVEEVTIEPGAACAGKRIKEVTWPRDCIISSLRIDKNVVIPHGNMILKPGNVLVVVVEGDAGAEVKSICQAQLEMSEQQAEG
jgi:CIC family chloride channel protein